MSYEIKKAILSINNLSVAYDGKVIIKDINLIEHDVVRPDQVQGQVIAVVGRSGRGKSTFFKALTGLVRPTTGTVLIPDLSNNEFDDEQRAREVLEGDVGFVDQKYTLLRHLTIEGMCHFALRKSDYSNEEKKNITERYLKDWELYQMKNQYPYQLSGGQRQRTAIIMQLLCSGHKNYYLVMDEPFSGLDVKNVNDVKKYFKLINNMHEQNTIIFSTHDIELAVELAQSIYVIGYPTIEGKLADYGTIVKHFDLKESGLAWQEEFNQDHIQLANQVKEVMFNT